MNDEIIYISDLFLEDVLGGAELNDHELCKILESDGYRIIKKRSQEVTLSFLKQYHGSKIILSNFAFIKEEIKRKINEDFIYVIYEHDHKYLRSRNPGIYKDYKAPAEDVINKSLYSKARAVLCQSKFHEKIVKNNLKIENTCNLSGNLWSDFSLNLMQELSKEEKRDRYSILNSQIVHKNTNKTIYFCKAKNYKYDLIRSNNYEEFLRMLARNKKLAFFPGTPETLSRVCVEARMLGVELLVGKNIGATHEDWIKLKGEDLVSFMRGKRIEIPNTVIGNLYD